MNWLIPLIAQATQPATDAAAEVATTQPAEVFSWHLTVGGWTIMLLSVGFVTGLLVWCVSRVLRESTADKLPSQIDIEPKDIVE